MEPKRKRGRAKLSDTFSTDPPIETPKEDPDAGISSTRRGRGRPRKPPTEPESQPPENESQTDVRENGRRQKSIPRPTSPLRNSLLLVNSVENGDHVALRWDQVSRVLPSMDAVVKVFCVHTEPNFSLPWQRKRQYSSSSSGFIIGNRRVLTNAHSVEHHTQVKLKKRGSDTKYLATVLAIGTECDIGTDPYVNVNYYFFISLMVPLLVLSFPGVKI